MGRLKQVLLRTPIVGGLWAGHRRRQLHRAYDSRREHYYAEATRRGLRYDETSTIREIADRLSKRGYSPQERTLGSIHTFAFIPRIEWHGALYPDLKELGPVSEFDYAAHGITWRSLPGRGGRLRTEVGRMFVEAFRQAHNARPVDWVFVYGSGREVAAESIRAITDEYGTPTVNMCLDDKQSWVGPRAGNQRTGQIDIASVFDVAWTSASVACEWYMCEGGRALYMPEGLDVSTYGPMSVPQDIPVSFIGGRYGFRPSVIAYLRRHSVPICVYGSGWGTRPLCERGRVDVLNRSIVNLGMGGIGYSEELTNVKGRDFEIPGTGGGVYITSFNPDLARHFDIGREILCYRNRQEMLELIRSCLADPDHAAAVARAGRARCLREHRWLNRYTRLLGILGIIHAASTR